MPANTALLARQPICDVDKEIVAYELLFRFEDGTINNTVDGDSATSQVLINAFSLGESDSITGGLPAYVNFTDKLLEVLPPVNPELLYIEILENIEINDHLIARIRELKAKGYKIVLDDFVWFDKYKPLLELADIVKLEIPAMGRTELRGAIANLRRYPVELLAEKIETLEEFEFCKKLGCTLFQGFFLYKPNLVAGQVLSSNKMSVLSLITALNDPDADVDTITSVITRDSGLSFKLLALINSAQLRRSVEVTSIATAVSLLGLERLKSWATVLTMTKLDDKPKSLLAISLQRAYFCELLAKTFALEQPEKFYMTGMLSSLDLFFDTPIQELITKLPLDAECKAALAEHQGLLGLVLQTAKLYEQFRLQDVPWKALRDLGLQRHDIDKVFVDSNTSANALIASL